MGIGIRNMNAAGDIDFVFDHHFAVHRNQDTVADPDPVSDHQARSIEDAAAYTPKAPKRFTSSPMVISTGPRMWGNVHMPRFFLPIRSGL